MCAANPRSRKATISSFFKSLALRFSFSVCCRTCLRVLFREGGLVVLRVASVTLYDAGDADIFSLSVEGECSKHKRERGERILASGAFSVSRKSKNSSGVAGDCFCASFAFFELVSFSLCLLFYTKACGCLKKMHLLIRRVSTFCVNKKTPTKRCQTLKKYSSQKSPHNLASHHHHHRERYQTHARRRLFSFSERESVEVRR